MCMYNAYGVRRNVYVGEFFFLRISSKARGQPHRGAPPLPSHVTDRPLLHTHYY